MTLDEIITRAIPRELCPVKDANAIHRREELKNRIELYISQQIEKKQLNETEAIKDY